MNQTNWNLTMSAPIHSRVRPKPLFAPINQVEFNSFAVQVRRPVPRPPTASYAVSRFRPPNERGDRVVLIISIYLVLAAFASSGLVTLLGTTFVQIHIWARVIVFL